MRSKKVDELKGPGAVPGQRKGSHMLLLSFAKCYVPWEFVLLDGVRQGSESKGALMREMLLGTEANTEY